MNIYKKNYNEKVYKYVSINENGSIKKSYNAIKKSYNAIKILARWFIAFYRNSYKFL